MDFDPPVTVHHLLDYCSIIFSQEVQLVSPASFSSSMDVTPYDTAIIPPSSLEFKGRTGESQNIKDLLKILNKIWSFEEQHGSNISLVKDLKAGLDHSLATIKDLLQEKQINRQDFMKQVAEDKLAGRSTEQDRTKSALQRQLTKRSGGSLKSFLR
ncbi:hypothetical protein Nepgr_002292 [Nepenthes gracilis]|uniref:Uncharacterized protein n=1 Tax=Nepenthes gracilis TaxID=150966 RepID=A0AAD3RY67_NEPGR|nr:hypothetical protein Nepgr_002292 [Nepenthes gracilis]